MSTITQATTKPTYQAIEVALFGIIKASILYKKPKDGKFMQRYKQKILSLRQSEDSEAFVFEAAQSCIPNETKYRQILDDNKVWYKREPEVLNAIIKLYRLYYELAKDHFATDAQMDQEANDFLNL